MPCASRVSIPTVQSSLILDCSYVAAGEVTTLEHELGDHAVELAAGVAEALLASAESAEVLSGGGDDVLVEVEVDAARALCDMESQCCVVEGADMRSLMERRRSRCTEGDGW